jgi:membrane-bound lytic murein transglycosylase D
MEASHKLILSSIVACSLAMQPISAQTTKQAKDTIVDKSIVVPESMNKDLSDLLHDWQIDFSSFQNDCQQGSNVVFNDSIYIQRLHNMPSFMELSYNHVVRSYIDMYADRKRSQVAYMLALGDYYFPMFEQMLDKYGLPLELKYLPVIESALNPVAVSRVGATGLWQFMLKTGKGYGLEINSLVDERRDPIKSSEAAARYLKDLYTIYQDWNLVIAAYNCGPGNVNKAIARSGGKRDYWEIYFHLPRETRGYVPAFIAANYIMNYYTDHNICPVRINDYVALDTVHVSEEIHLQQISDILDIPLTELRRLNPQFKRDIIPGNYKSYALNLPTKKMIAFIDQKDSITNYRRSEFLTHRLSTDRYISNNYNISTSSDGTYVYYKVRRGDNLSKIAQRNGVTVSQLKSWNNLKSSRITAGKRLIVNKRKIETPKSSPEESQTLLAQTDNEQHPAESRSVNQYYRVRKGDTLSGIAQKNNVTVSQLKAWNGLNSTKLSIGKKLIVQKKTVKTPSNTQTNGESYSAPGKTESSIISNYLKDQIGNSAASQQSLDENTDQPILDSEQTN